MTKNKTTIILSIIILLLWLVVPYWIKQPEFRGYFGDQFGFTSSLFSGASLVLIAYSIYLQTNENRVVNQILIHRDFQKEIHEIFDKFKISVKTEGWVPNIEEAKLISSYWYLVFDEWFVCHKQGNESLKKLWDDYYVKGAESMLKTPAFRNSILEKINREYSFLGTGKEFGIVIKKIIEKIDSETTTINEAL